MANPNTIPYYRYQDIQIPDVELRKQFDLYILQGNYSSALNLLSTNEQQLVGKAYIADTINRITNGVMVLEHYYYDNVPTFLNEKLQYFLTMVNNLRNAGNWNSNTQYYQYNFVLYNQEYYFCIQQPPVGTLPTDETYWLYLGLKGKDGVPGVDLVMQYNWVDNATYQPNDLVVYGSAIYVALRENTNVIPLNNEDDWLLFLQPTVGGIYVGITPPTDYVNDTIWFQTDTDPSTQSGTSSIIGQFKRYIEEFDIWDEMYPNTVFTLVLNTDNYSPAVKEYSVNVALNTWNGNQRTFYYNDILSNSTVDIFLQQGVTVSQQILFSSLSILVQTGSFVLTSDITPNTDLNIIVRIY